MTKAYTMSHLVINDKAQHLPVGFGELHNLIEGLNPDTIQIVFEHEFAAEPIDEEILQEPRMFRVYEYGTGQFPAGYDYLSHFEFKDGRLFHIYAEPDYRKEPVKKEASVKTVHRDYLSITPAVQTKRIGQGALLHAAEDRQGLGRIDIWYEVDTNVPTPVLARNFVIIQTGETLTLPGYTYFTTVVMANGQIFHIYAQYGF